MFSIISWAIYGIIVGSLAKFLHPGKEPGGCLPTILVGVAGSFLGGLVNFLLGFGTTPFAPAGIVMGVVGGVLFCFIYRKYIEKEEVKND